MREPDDRWVQGGELEAVLSEAFERAADALVEARWQPMSGSGWSPTRPVKGRRRRRTGWAVFAALLIVLAGAATAVAIVVHADSGRDGAAGALTTTSGGTPANPTSAPATPPSHANTSTTATPAGPVRTVRVTAQETDGSVYGIGMPIVVYFHPAPRDVSAFAQDTTVTVDGRPAGGGWYWVEPTADQKRHHELEAHYRPRTFWPAHSQVHVAFGFGGRSAGRGLVFAKGLTSLDYRIGAAHVSVVHAGGPGRLYMEVTNDGRFERKIPVSLGAAGTPTYEGIKIVMQKGEDVPGTGRLRPDGTVLMSGPGYTDHPVPWSVRITRSGEYVHAASWNDEIGERSTSNGCTNLSPADARWFYGFSQLGDVVRYPSTDGGSMPSWDGVRDWNVPWSQWLSGGPAKPAG